MALWKDAANNIYDDMWRLLLLTYNQLFGE